MGRAILNPSPRTEGACRRGGTVRIRLGEWRGIPRRLPFTITMESVILAIAFLDGAMVGHLSWADRLRWGFSAADLTGVGAYTLLTGAFFVRTPLMLLGILVFVPFALGLYERRRGTRRALALFWSANVLGFALIGLLTLPAFGAAPFMPHGEVGPSVGGVACLGAWVTALPSGRRRACLYGIAALYLVGKIVFFRDPAGDLEHLIAFPLGMTMEWLTRKPEGPADSHAR